MKMRGFRNEVWPTGFPLLVSAELQMSKMPVLDAGKCRDCEACLELCPDVFKKNDAGYIEVVQMTFYPEDCIQEAINCCPTDCIWWEES